MKQRRWHRRNKRGNNRELTPRQADFARALELSGVASYVAAERAILSNDYDHLTDWIDAMKRIRWYQTRWRSG